jgi:hypothetical protein
VDVFQFPEPEYCPAEAWMLNARDAMPTRIAQTDFLIKFSPHFKMKMNSYGDLISSLLMSQQ